MREFYALWLQDHRLDEPIQLMSERTAMERNAAIAAQGITHLRWKEHDLTEQEENELAEGEK